jgi:NAD-dependent dihydropyrimidine dehydrogenase PreA subunit
MKKALVNYWVDMVTGVAFLFCAVTGILRLFPAETVSISSGGQAVIFGVSVAAWQTIHDWSGAIMAAGVGVHTVLHLRWLAHMTRRIASGDAKRSGRVVPAGGSRTARVPATAVAASAAAGDGGTQSGAPRSVAAGELERLERTRADRRRDKERRHTRKAFLTGAAAVGGAALLVGLGLAGRDAASGLLGRSAEQASTDQLSWEDQAEADDSGYSAGMQDSSAGGGSSSAGSGATARVAVDSGSCAGCGACLQVCPAGVFAASGGVAVAQATDACQLCGRCTQVCRPGAITLNG